MTSAQERKIRQTGCDTRFDNLTRQLYSTDASIYQIHPVGAAFPKTAEQASLVIRAAADAGLSITPGGAGTSLVGNAIGEGLIVDFSRYNRRITDLDLEKRSVRVGAGVVLDQLNEFLKPHGFCFGPDVATSSRATLGGMIANNSSGARCPIYGTTSDHVISLEIVLADGRVEKIGANHESLVCERAKIEKLVRAASTEMAERWPPGLIKRWPGYGIERFLRVPNDLTNILAGSEGTLAAIFSAELKISPLPHEKGLGLIFFASVAEAMQATVEFLALKPAAIDHIDRVLLDQSRGQLEFQAARDLLDLDHKPCESILAVEFFEDVPARLAALEKRKLGLRTTIVKNDTEANLVWAMRKAGLSLITGRKGDAKPVTGIEDVAVRPKDLPAYVAGLQSIMSPLGLEASYYGHAAAGLLHVRPVLDLRTEEDLQKFRQVTNQVSALVLQFKGSLAGEHGVGMARTEFMGEQLGENLLHVMAEIKTSFDPHNLFNPGKIVHDGRFHIDENLRLGPGYRLSLPFTPVLAFAAKDGSFAGNLEQCNGCGGCRKENPTMCPTFIATGGGNMSTPGRANPIRAALEMRGVGNRDPLCSTEMEAALSNCLSCKACTVECPSNVNLALLKAELLHGRIQRDSLTMRERLFSSLDFLGKLGCRLPRLTNAALGSFFTRTILAKSLGIALQRPLPHYARHRFDKWFWRHTPTHKPSRGRVILWDDTFVRYHEPHIGIAAVKVLEAAGVEVNFPARRKSCGRAGFRPGKLRGNTAVGPHQLS